VSGELEPGASVYYCLVCGPCFRENFPDGAHITYHLNVPHPEVLTYDEESNPQ